MSATATLPQDVIALDAEWHQKKRNRDRLIQAIEEACLHTSPFNRDGDERFEEALEIAGALISLTIEGREMSTKFDADALRLIILFRSEIINSVLHGNSYTQFKRNDPATIHAAIKINADIHGIPYDMPTVYNEEYKRKLAIYQARTNPSSKTAWDAVPGPVRNSIVAGLLAFTAAAAVHGIQPRFIPDWFHPIFHGFSEEKTQTAHGLHHK